MEKPDEIKEEPRVPTEESTPQEDETEELDDQNLEDVSGGLNPQPLPPIDGPHERNRY